MAGSAIIWKKLPSPSLYMLLSSVVHNRMSHHLKRNPPKPLVASSASPNLVVRVIVRRALTRTRHEVQQLKQTSSPCDVIATWLLLTPRIYSPSLMKLLAGATDQGEASFGNISRSKRLLRSSQNPVAWQCPIVVAAASLRDEP
jgi:hypothetical protein